MLRWRWPGVLCRWPVRTHSRGIVLELLLVFVVLGLVGNGWRAVCRLWQEYQRPVAVYRRAIPYGVAISLNALAERSEQGRQLPHFDIRGVLLDWEQNDWILFGEEDQERPALPLDAITIALRAIRSHLEAPGIDIRPQQRTPGTEQSVQQISYFGGVQDSVVGQWFFLFDYWMKRISLADEPVPTPDIPVYWHRAVEALEQDIKACRTTSPEVQIRRNRYWLCAGDMPGIEGDDTLVFQASPLQVLAESVAETLEAREEQASPCSSRGISDTLAAEFASRLTAHLSTLTHVVPVAQIEDFTRLMAGFAWLSALDPYHEVRWWLRVPLSTVETPTTVPTLVKQTVREHICHQHSGLVRHHYQLELSGGVLVKPSLIRARVGDHSLRLLREAILAARPLGKAVLWHFTYYPPST